MTVVDLSGTSVMIDDLVKEARTVLADGKISFGEVVHLGGVLAGKASQFVHLSGKQKQTLVIRVVEVALETILAERKTADSDEFRKKIEAAALFAKETLPAVLDLAVQAAKGQLNVLAPQIRQSIWTVLCSLLHCAGVPRPEVPKAVEMIVLGTPEAPKEESTHPLESSKVAEVRPANTVSE